jgi:hypothetical protein
MAICGSWVAVFLFTITTAQRWGGEANESAAGIFRCFIGTLAPR